MVIVWKKGTILRMRRRAGGIFSLKEKNTVTIGQIQPISLLNVEGKIFFSLVARRTVRQQGQKSEASICFFWTSLMPLECRF